MEAKVIINILKKHEAKTFPNGVGSVEWILQESSYEKVAEDILQLMETYHKAKLEAMSNYDLFNILVERKVIVLNKYQI